METWAGDDPPAASSRRGSRSLVELLSDRTTSWTIVTALMKALDTAAFIISVNGTVLYANDAGERRIRASSDGLRRTLRGVLRRSRHEPTDDVLVVDAGAARGFVVLYGRSSSSEPLSQVISAWALTPRQAAVLALVAEGHPNKVIASRLACTERTVETHLSAIFAKSGCDGRSVLLARLGQARRGDVEMSEH